MIKWPDSLVRDIALRKCIFVLGSGISLNATSPAGTRPKIWKEFLEAAAQRITPLKLKKEALQLIKERDYLTACEVIRNSLGRPEFIDFMTEEFQAPGFRPDEIHASIFKLDTRIVITPNFDNIYDRYAYSESKGTILVKRYNENDIAESIRINKRLIIKMHGSIDSPNEVIFTRGDYARARTNQKTFYTILDALTITNTFLFLGCGTNDPDIRLMLEDYNYRHEFSREHFFAMSKKTNFDSVNEIIQSTMNLKILQYDGKNYHKELKDSLEELVGMVENKRAEIAANQSW